MGQSKGGGYLQKETLLPQQMELLNKILAQSQPYTQQAAQGYAQFLPGGGGGEAIKKAALQNYQQQTLPAILQAFGRGNKGSSALNNAVAQSSANLESNLGAQLAQMQLQASQGLGSLGQAGTQLGLGTPGFAYLQEQQPFWQSALLGLINAGGQLGSAALGKPPGV